MSREKGDAPGGIDQASPLVYSFSISRLWHTFTALPVLDNGLDRLSIRDESTEG